MARVGRRAKLEARMMPKSMRLNLDRVRQLAKPEHTWWFVFIKGAYVGNVPGPNYAGAVKRGAKVYVPDFELKESDLSPPEYPSRANQALTANEINDRKRIEVCSVIVHPRAKKVS